MSARHARPTRGRQARRAAAGWLLVSLALLLAPAASGHAWARRRRPPRSSPSSPSSPTWLAAARKWEADNWPLGQPIAAVPPAPYTRQTPTPMERQYLAELASIEAMVPPLWETSPDLPEVAT